MAKLAKKVLSVLLILSVLMGLVGCSLFDKIHVTTPNDVELTAPELVRILVTAINDEMELSDSYAAIPEAQRENVSYSTFFEYISLIREFTSRYGKIASFSFLNDEENSRHLDDIYNRLYNSVSNSGNNMFPVDDFRSVFMQYGGVRTVSLEFNKEVPNNMYIYITVDKDNEVKLSYELISHSLSLYNYMQQYFSMITNKETDGIQAFINLIGNVPEDFKGSILHAKAEFYVDFYNFRVKNRTSQFQITAINPLFIEYRIPEVLSADNSNIYERNIAAYRKPSGEITISDVIPQETNIEIATVNVNQSQYIRCGLEYDYSAITRICGKPLSLYLNKDVVVDEITDSEGNVTVKNPLVVSYNGMNLIFNARYKSDKEWIGELVSIRLYSSTNSNYPVCGIRVGDSELKILEHFPMTNYGEYNFSLETYLAKFNLEYEISNKTVESIILTKGD